MDILKSILSIVAFSVVVLVVYNLLKSYVLHKVNVNKWIILVAAMVLFIVPVLIWPNMPKAIANYVIPAAFVILFLWFLDLSGFMKKRNLSKANSKTTSKTTSKPNIVRANVKKDKKKDVVIRPKAKPNRVKNNEK